MDANDDKWLRLDGDFSGEARKLLFEQYKMFVDTTSKVSDRRGLANTFQMTVNTGLVTVYGLIAGKEASLGTGQGPWQWLLPAAGLVICIAWFALIWTYRALNSAKFDVISELERELPAQLFDREWMLKRRTFLGRLELTWIELCVPFIFGAIYLFLLVAYFVKQGLCA